jgi:hypothetical protein
MVTFWEMLSGLLFMVCSGHCLLKFCVGLYACKLNIKTKTMYKPGYVSLSFLLQCLITHSTVSDHALYSVWSPTLQCLITHSTVSDHPIYSVWSPTLQCLITHCTVSDHLLYTASTQRLLFHLIKLFQQFKL